MAERRFSSSMAKMSDSNDSAHLNHTSNSIHPSSHQQSYSDLLIENARLKSRLAELSVHSHSNHHDNDPHQQAAANPYNPHGLSSHDILRYSRQLLLSDLGTSGLVQQAYKSARLLIIGAGGLGCPVAIYCAAAGIGNITIIDNDVVDLSNLHRQVGHREESIGLSKAHSLSSSCAALNSSINLTPIQQAFNLDNALELASSHDILVDCSDNVATRYLINDVGILSNKPVISGSALRLEGQLTVYGYDGGPCYRCIFPLAPPPHTVTNCSDGGVLGVITGIIGSLQALEVLKLLAKKHSDNNENIEILSQRMLLFDGLSSSVRNVKLRGKNNLCEVCGEKPTITMKSLKERLYDYTTFCSSQFNDKPNNIVNSINFTLTSANSGVTVKSVEVKEYEAIYNNLCNNPHILLDVRETIQYHICHLPNSINIPLRQLTGSESVQQLVGLSSAHNNPIYIICRRGIDSLLAAHNLRSLFPHTNIYNIVGGLTAWYRNALATIQIPNSSAASNFCDFLFDLYLQGHSSR
jgi:adenylyltransferase/sulfurtransferase